MTVPAGYKIIGGGAHVEYEGPGSLLTASYPDGPSTWVARSKDHEQPSPARVVAWAVALYDPNDEWEVRVVSETSSPTSHPTASATLPQGYTMTGGGAEAHWTGEGSLLTASYPEGPQTWQARSKDHLKPDPAALTVYVIGIRPRNGASAPRNVIFEAQSENQSHPSATASIQSGYVLVSGGAEVNWRGAGNLLTASYPDGRGGWIAASKDHLVPDSAVIVAYAIGVRPQIKVQGVREDAFSSQPETTPLESGREGVAFRKLVTEKKELQRGELPGPHNVAYLKSTIAIETDPGFRLLNGIVVEGGHPWRIAWQRRTNG